MICHFCNKKLIKKKFYLYDRNKVKTGEYCSSTCAKDDAWGPRFEKFKIIPVRFKK